MKEIYLIKAVIIYHIKSKLVCCILEVEYSISMFNGMQCVALVGMSGF